MDVTPVQGPILELPGGDWLYPVELVGRGVDGELYRVVYESPTNPGDPVLV